MKIDEAIKWLTEHFLPDGIVDYKQAEAIKTIGDFYEWYKSQDLVRRDDIKDKAVCAYGLPCQFDHKCYKCEYALLTMNNIYDISKVEYGGIE